MTPSQALYVGIDAGGTRTRALLADARGTLLGSAVGGGGNFQELGADGLAGHIARLLRQLAPPSPPAALCAGVAGAGRGEEQAAVVEGLRRCGAAERCAVVSDARAALEGAHGGRAGIVCIAGTGSMVLGRNDAGAEARAGGWGPTLGDEGSAYALVLAAVRAVLRARDGWGPVTALTERLPGILELRTWDDVVGAVYGGRLTRERLAAACPQVFATAAAGDAVASQVVADGAAALGRQAAAVAARLGLAAPAPVACQGGVFHELETLWPLMSAAAGAGVLACRPARLPAVHGALLLAAAAVGHDFGAAAVARWTTAGP